MWLKKKKKKKKKKKNTLNTFYWKAEITIVKCFYKCLCLIVIKVNKQTNKQTNITFKWLPA